MTATVRPSTPPSDTGSAGGPEGPTSSQKESSMRSLRFRAYPELFTGHVWRFPSVEAARAAYRSLAAHIRQHPQAGDWSMVLGMLSGLGLLVLFIPPEGPQNLLIEARRMVLERGGEVADTTTRDFILPHARSGSGVKFFPAMPRPGVESPGRFYYRPAPRSSAERITM